MFFSTQELVQTLKNINIYVSPDGSFNPDQQTMLQILSEFGELLADNEQIQKVILNQLPPDYSQEQFRFLKLLGQCNNISFKVGLEPFTLRDLIEISDLKKFKQFFYQSAKYKVWKENEKEKGKYFIDKMQQLQLINDQCQQQAIEFQKFFDEVKLKDKQIREQFEDEQQKKEMNLIHLQKLKKEEERKNMILQREKQQFDDQINELSGLCCSLLMYSDRKYHFESQIIQDYSYIQLTSKDAELHLQQLDKELQQKQKEQKLEEFKNQVYNRFLVELIFSHQMFAQSEEIYLENQ